MRLPDEIDSDYCIVQVVESLHKAQKLAQQQNDTKVMMDVVAGWFELHERFVVAEEEEQRPRFFGFQSTRDEEEELEPAISHEEHVPFEQLELEEEETDE